MKRMVYVLILLVLVSVLAVGCAQQDTVPASEGENGSNNAAMGGLSVFSDGMIYYVGEGENGGETLCSMTENGENETILYTPTSPLDQISYVNCDGMALYFLETVLDPEWLGIAEQRICKYDLQSGEVTVLAATENAACLTLHGDWLYFTENNTRLLRLSRDGGTPQDLCNSLSESFVIYGDRLWFGVGTWLDAIVSCDLNGGDRREHYRSEYGVTLHAVHNDRIYFYEDAFEDRGTTFSMALDGSDQKELSRHLGSGCNPVGDLFYMALIEKADIVSDGDLTVTPSANPLGTEPVVIDPVSGSDLQTEEPPPSVPLASGADLDIEGEDTVTITPGSLTVCTYELTRKGGLKKIAEKEYIGEGLYTQSLGCFSGNWRFYVMPEKGIGRTLYKEKLN